MKYDRNLGVCVVDLGAHTCFGILAGRGENGENGYLGSLPPSVSRFPSQGLFFGSIASVFLLAQADLSGLLLFTATEGSTAAIRSRAWTGEVVRIGITEKTWGMPKSYQEAEVNPED